MAYEKLLIAAVELGDVAQVKRVLEIKDFLGKTVDPNTKKEDQPVLHIATRRGDMAIMDALLDKGAKIDSTDQRGAKLDTVEKGKNLVTRNRWSYPAILCRCSVILDA